MSMYWKPLTARYMVLGKEFCFFCPHPLLSKQIKVFGNAVLYALLYVVIFHSSRLDFRNSRKTGTAQEKKRPEMYFCSFSSNRISPLIFGLGEIILNSYPLFYLLAASLRFLYVFFCVSYRKDILNCLITKFKKTLQIKILLEINTL
jgi:hypothetical protein